MEREEKKGTVTTLSSIFPPEETQKASKRVLDKIAELEKELDQLDHFIFDNSNLINIVQRLPDEIHHDIMVPYGKEAFFRGRLVHTNEFLVLLGEGYYADRTSKQTTEILKRRGNTLESQVESVKAVMQNLKAEASFFDTTAAEAAEGLVEIVEDYVEEASSEKVSIAENKRGVVEDEEYARLLSRMDELEKQELEAEEVNEHEQDEADLSNQLSRVSVDHEVKSSQMDPLNTSLEKSKDVLLTRKFEDRIEQGFSDQLKCEASKVQSASKDGRSQGSRNTISKSSITEKEPEAKIQVQHTPLTEAFTRSIVEHTHNLDNNPRQQEDAAASTTSKPVSRFKMQRRQQ